MNIYLDFFYLKSASLGENRGFLYGLIQAPFKGLNANKSSFNFKSLYGWLRIGYPYLPLFKRNTADISLISHQTIGPRASPGRTDKVKGLFYSLWHKQKKLIKAKK